MTDLQTTAEQYLATRRAVGFKLTHVEPLLFDFLRFAHSRNATHVTCDLALQWATASRDATSGWWKGRLCVVRCFARYLSAVDPATEVPPTGLLPRVAGGNRARPYLYSDAEVAALLTAARSIRSALTAATCSTLIGLLACTGMRVGEALRLDRDDLDRVRGVLIVRDSKFDRSREVPLHETALAALDRYGRLRDTYYPTPQSPSLFISRTGARLSYSTMNGHFGRLVRKAGLAPRTDRCRPRMQDLRHRFACLTVQQWYRDGVDVQPRLPLLSTYLGHVNPVSTYWYLSAQPDLLNAAAARLESSLRESV